MEREHETGSEARDLYAADTYVERTEAAKLNPGAMVFIRTRGYLPLTQALREAYLQGWHEAMVARDEDD